MCCCGKPTINGQPGYSWDGKTFGVRQPSPPPLLEGDELIYDEPGRCGGCDSHSYHFRVIKRGGGYALLVRHGGGDESYDLGRRVLGMAALAALVAPGQRYWLLQMFYHVMEHECRASIENETRKWRRAAAEKRIKTRKQRNGSGVKVWIEEKDAAR